MRTALGLGLLCASMLCGQANFELQSPPCSYVFPGPCGAAGDPEGVTRKLPSFAGNTIASVDTPNLAGMPCSGVQYARIVATGPLNAPIGGPMPAIPSLGSRLFIPIPAGATWASLCWDFYLVDNPPQTAYNDGMSIDFIGGCNGATLANIAYADAFSQIPAAIADVGSTCPSYGWEVAPLGQPQFVYGTAVPPGATHISVTVWNGGDDFASSHGVIDDVAFGTGAVPCKLAFSSPGGPGSVLMVHTPCQPAAGALFFVAATLNAGSFPNGWFFGIDISFPELAAEIAGPPFVGTLNAAGAATTGPAFGLPSGLVIHAIDTDWAPQTLILVRSPAVAYVIP
jgi:hypothetical protein